MERPADVVKKIPLNKPEQTPTDDDPDIPETLNVASTQFVGFRCQIPSLWKRLGAEIIDFILLTLIKCILAFFVYIIFGIDLSKYNAILLQDYYNMNYSTVIEFTYKLFVLEVSHKIIVCLYEIYWLHGSTLFHGGGTIGKILLGLTVVQANKLYNIRGQPNDNIALTPGGDLGWKRAILRSLTKNAFYSLIFPLPFIMAAAYQNRCAYDIMWGTMVVEVLQPLRCHKSELIPIT